MRPFLLRRTKAEVEQDLPEKTEIVDNIELQGAQRIGDYPVYSVIQYG